MASERHRMCLQGVLQYAIEHSGNENETNDVSSAKCDEMDLERKEFLENALKSMTVDVVEELQNAIQSLSCENSSVEEKVEALNVVRDYAGNLDFANNFISIGGSKVAIQCLKSSHTKLRICAAYVIAELSQNNPFCQKHFLEADVLRPLILYTKLDGDVASSSMHAISSLVRNFEDGCAKFVAMSGIECIIECLLSSHSNVFVKSCFLLRALATEYAPVRDTFVKLGAVETLANFVDPVIGFDLKIETILSALCALTQSDEGKLHFRSTNISSVLQNIIEKNNGKAECEEILRDSALLLDCLRKDK